MDRVTDGGPDRKYHIAIPNLIDDSGLDPYCFRLYVHLKRRAGDDGKCWESTENIAKECCMSVGQVVKAKRTLESRKLITIEQEPNARGGRCFHHIKIVDIWPENTTKYSQKPTSLHEVATSPDEPTTSYSELASSPREVKKNPIQEEPMKKNPKKNEANIRKPLTVPTFGIDSDEYQLTMRLCRRMRENDPQARIPTKEHDIQRWCRHTNLLIRADGRDPPTIRAVIDSCQSDEFWKSNILSTQKLRKQFGTLYLQMQRKNGRTTIEKTSRIDTTTKPGKYDGISVEIGTG